MEFLSNPVVRYEASWFFVLSVCDLVLSAAVKILGGLGGIVCGTIAFFAIMKLYTRFLDPTIFRPENTRRPIYFHDRLVNYIEKSIVSQFFFKLFENYSVFTFAALRTFRLSHYRWCVCEPVVAQRIPAFCCGY